MARRMVVLALLIVMAVAAPVTRSGGVPVVAGSTSAVAAGWGYDLHGELGDNAPEGQQNTPVQVLNSAGDGPLEGVATIAAGSSHSLAVDSDGYMWGWGNNFLGTLGNGEKGDDEVLPVRVRNYTDTGALSGIRSADGGAAFSVALSNAGSVWAWGSGFNGELGNNVPGQRDLPALVLNSTNTGALSGITAISAGDKHALALASDGTVWAWGSNVYGQLGDNTLTQRNLPVHVLNVAGKAGTHLSNVVAVAAGGDHSLALLADGTVVAWGRNDAGQVGDGTLATPRKLPVVVKNAAGTGSLVRVRSIAAGRRTSYAVLSDGTAVAWGLETSGETGDGSIGGSEPLPKTVVTADGTLSGVQAITAGSSHALALMANGDVYGWGYNQSGQVGDGTSGNKRERAVRVLNSAGSAPLSNVIALAAGTNHTLAIVDPIEAVASGPASTNERDIAVSLSGRGAFPVNGWYLSEVAGTPTPGGWSPVPITSFTLSPGDGLKTVYAYVRDDHDYVSAPVSFTVRLDTAAPTASLNLKPFTRSTTVGLTLRGLDAQGVVAYYLSTEFAVPPVDIAGWQTAAPKTFKLGGADGTKTVYAWTRDAAGNVSATASDTTFLDRGRPIVTIGKPRRLAKLQELKSIAGGTNDRSPSSGIARSRFAIRWKQGTTCKWWKPKQATLVAGACNAPLWFPLPRTKAWTRPIGKLDDPGRFRVIVEVKDRAGNRTTVGRSFAIVKKAKGTPAER